MKIRNARTILFFLLIVVIILVAYALRSPNKVINDPGESQQYTDVLLTAAHWKSILVGNWSINQVDSNTEEKWQREGLLEINKDHNFLLRGKENYLQLYRNDIRDLLSTTSGGASGKWYVSDSCFMLTITQCDFKFTKITTDFSGRDQDKSLMFKCPQEASLDSSIISYGAISSLTYKSQVKVLDENNILITGSNYKINCEFSYRFRKLKD